MTKLSLATNELGELLQAAEVMNRAWREVRPFGWVGTSTTGRYVSLDDFHALLRVGQRFNAARTAALARAFA